MTIIGPHRTMCIRNEYGCYGLSYFLKKKLFFQHDNYNELRVFYSKYRYIRLHYKNSVFFFRSVETCKGFNFE